MAYETGIVLLPCQVTNFLQVPVPPAVAAVEPSSICTVVHGTVAALSQSSTGSINVAT